MIMTLSTNAALCTVQVSNNVLQRDLVLHLVLKLVQQKTHQLQVKVQVQQGTKTKQEQDGVLSMSLAGTSTQALQQRNAILRSLVGAALHGALDDSCRFGSLGGGWFAAAASPHSTSIAAAVHAARQQQWMSVADELRQQQQQPNDDDGNVIIMLLPVLQELNQILTECAFVLPYAAQPTLADLDLGVALLQHSAPLSSFPAAVQRWLTQIRATLQDLANETNVSLEPYQLQHIPKPAPIPAPMFFDGTEDAEQVIQELYKKSATAVPPLAVNTAVAKPAPSPTKPPAKDADVGAGKPKLTKQEKKQAAKNQPDGATATDAPKQQQQPPNQAPTEYDVTALDIRVGKIIKVWPHEEAEKLYCEEIDLGNGEIRQIASGLRPFYKSPQDLQDRYVLVLCNLKKRNLVGFASHGMVLCASNDDHTEVVLVQPAQGTAIGERVVFDGLSPDAPPEPETKVAKKKIFEQLAPHLRTDAHGAVVWKAHAAQTLAGPVTALNQMPHAHVS